MLLKAEGIDVNNEVVHLPLTISFSHSPTTLIPLIICLVCLSSFPSSVTSRGSLGEWSYRHSSYVIEGRWD